MTPPGDVGRKWPTLAATSESAYSKPARKRRHVGSARSEDARKIAGRERRRSERIGGQMQLEVSFERNEIYECGAVLLTLLACPKELDKPRSLDRFLSLCGKALWLKHLASPDDVADHGEAAICIPASGYHRSRRSFCRKATRGKNGSPAA